MTYHKCIYRTMIDAEKDMGIVLPHEEKDLCSICTGYDIQCESYQVYNDKKQRGEDGGVE